MTTTPGHIFCVFDFTTRCTRARHVFSEFIAYVLRHQVKHVQPTSATSRDAMIPFSCLSFQSLFLCQSLTAMIIIIIIITIIPTTVLARMCFFIVLYGYKIRDDD